MLLLRVAVINMTYDKKLTCRRETARCIQSLNISLSHPRLLEFIRNDVLE